MKRSLFVTSNRLGDAVLTTGILHDMIKKEPDIPVTVVCGTLPADIFESVPGVDQVIPIIKQKYNMHWIKAAKTAGLRRWHRIVDFRGSIFSVMPGKYRHIWRGGDDTVHKTIANARLLGVENAIPPKIIPTAQQDEWAQAVIGCDNTPVLALAPTANFYQKQWHHQNFLSLAKSLTAPDGILPAAKIIIFGAPGEEAQAQPVVDGLPENQVINMIGKTTPVQAAALLSKANLFVGNDSGLMHSAVAVNIPTVGLFGIGKPAVYGPWGPKSLCVRGTPAGAALHEAPEGENDVLPLQKVLSATNEFYTGL
ncbi:MAG: glycosyltransferase family 9 protein [Sneathiellales bacterium]|nr:glycosyltransferase family 9 protein [Sneathiellales bacterium]